MYLIEVEVLLNVIVPEVARLRVLMRVRHVGDVANSCGISNTMYNQNYNATAK